MSEQPEQAAQLPMPRDIWDRMMAGEITSRQAVEEARNAAPNQQAFNDELRREMSSGSGRELARREQLRARLFSPPPERRRDEAGRFVGDGSFDPGPRGPLPQPRGERERVNEAIDTLQELRRI